MRTSAPALLPLFRSQTQLDLLGSLFASEVEVTVGDLAVRIGAPIPRFRVR